MSRFNYKKFQDCLTSLGYGLATDEGVAVGQQLVADGYTYAAAASEVGGLGFTSPRSEEGKD